MQYPRTSDWKNSTYKKLKIRELDKNISIHLNSFIWSTMKIAEQMKKKEKRFYNNFKFNLWCSWSK